MSGQDSTVEVPGVSIEIRRVGSGPPLLFLHGEDGLLWTDAFLDRLGEHHEVIAPSHPGWAGSKRPDHVEDIADLAYTYLDLLRAIADAPVPVVGVSFGGWLAAEIAVRCDHDVAALVLAAPVGIKIGGREERDYVDLYATHPDDVTAALYADPKDAPALSDLQDDQFREFARAQEAVARYGWQPYLHTTNLPHRLHRVRVPSLVVSGSEDRFVLQEGFYDHYAAMIGGGAERAIINGAGHRIEEETPADLASTIAKFLRNA